MFRLFARSCRARGTGVQLRRGARLEARRKNASASELPNCQRLIRRIVINTLRLSVFDRAVFDNYSFKAHCYRIAAKPLKLLLVSRGMFLAAKEDSRLLRWSSLTETIRRDLSISRSLCSDLFPTKNSQ